MTQPILIPGRDTLPRGGNAGDVVTKGAGGRASYAPPLVREQVTLGTLDIANGYIQCAQDAAPDSLVMRVLGAGDQIYGTDYFQDGRKARWDGKALEGVLIAGDVLILEYRKLPS